MPKVPVQKEQSQQSMFNPTGLPNNASSTGVGSLGKGIQQLGENLERLEKSKKSAKNTLNIAKAKGLFMKWRAETDNLVESERFPDDQKASAFVKDNHKKFMESARSEFGEDFHPMLDAIGDQHLAIQLKKTFNTQRKRDDEDFVRTLGQVTSNYLSAVDEDPSSLNNVLYESTEILASTLTQAGMNKDKVKREVEGFQKRVILGAADRESMKGNIRGALGTLNAYKTRFSPEEYAKKYKQYEDDWYRIKSREYSLDRQKRLADKEELKKQQGQNLIKITQALDIASPEQIALIEEQVHSAAAHGLISIPQWRQAQGSISQAKKDRSLIASTYILARMHEVPPKVLEQDILNFFDGALIPQHAKELIKTVQAAKSIRRSYDPTLISGLKVWIESRVKARGVLAKWNQDAEQRAYGQALMKFTNLLYENRGRDIDPSDLARQSVEPFVAGREYRGVDTLEFVPVASQDNIKALIDINNQLTEQVDKGLIEYKEGIRRIKLIDARIKFLRKKEEQQAADPQKGKIKRALEQAGKIINIDFNDLTDDGEATPVDIPLRR